MWRAARGVTIALMRVFCPECGTKLEPKKSPPRANGPWKVACPVCDTRFDAWAAEQVLEKKRRPGRKKTPTPSDFSPGSSPPASPAPPAGEVDLSESDVTNASKTASATTSSAGDTKAASFNKKLDTGESTRPVAPPFLPSSAVKDQADDEQFNTPKHRKLIGPYEILEEISRGGMGIVYRALDPLLRRQVALKVLLAGGGAGTEDLRRFRREAQAVARLHHPNIVSVHTVGEDEGRPYLVMDFIKGATVKSLIAKGRMTPRQALTVTEQIAEAVYHAHQHGVVHRDVKPANILIDEHGTAKIMDFGLARRVDEDLSITQTGTTVGTPAYMPPEQAEGRLELVDGRSDIYSLGACFYEMLTGKPPFDAPTTIATLKQVIDDEPVPPRKINPRIHPDVETICLKCLEKDRRQRYPDGRALAADLRAFNAGEAVAAVPQGIWTRLWRRWKKRKEALFAVAAALAVAFVGTGYFFYQERAAEKERLRLRRQRAAAAVATAAELRRRVDEILPRLDSAAPAEERRLSGELEGLLEQTRRAYQKIEWLSPDSKKARRGLEFVRRAERTLEVRRFLQLARGFLAKKNYSAALAFAETALTREPGNREAERLQHNAVGYGRVRLEADGPPAKVWAKPLGMEGLGLSLGRTPVRGRELRIGRYVVTTETAAGVRQEATLAVARDKEAVLLLHTSSKEPNMAYVPAGEVLLPEGLREVSGEERAKVPAFYIDRFEYPNRAGFPPRHTIGAGLLEIRELCRKQGKKLCTVRQWLRACRGDTVRKWPYGSSYLSGVCAGGFYPEDRKTPFRSGEKTRCRTARGVYDMSGNMAEWTDAAGKIPGAAYGGDWTSSVRVPDLTLSCTAGELPEGVARERLGFRCCKPAEQ